MALVLTLTLILTHTLPFPLQGSAIYLLLTVDDATLIRMTDTHYHCHYCYSCCYYYRCYCYYYHPQFACHSPSPAQLQAAKKAVKQTNSF
jgi:hypothetical protein